MNLFLELLPMMLGTALAPVWIIIVLLILKNKDGLVKAIAFVAGITIVRLLQGVIVGSILRNADGFEQAGGASPIVSTLLMVLGILLLITAVKKLMSEESLDTPPPRWITELNHADALQLLGMGALGTLIAPKLWVFTLSAIGIILNADLGSAGQEFKTFLLYVLGAQFMLFLPLLLRAIAPRQSTNLLNAASNWLNQHNRQITLVVCTVFGIYFLSKGLSGLTA